MYIGVAPVPRAAAGVRDAHAFQSGGYGSGARGCNLVVMTAWAYKCADNWRGFMDELLDNAVDLAICALVLLSGLHAFWRGFLRESLNIIAWIVAIYGGIYAYPLLGPTVREYVPNATAANWIAGAAVGIAILIALSVLIHQLVRLLRRAGVGAVDRSLGFLFGLIRGAALVSLCFLLLQQIVKDETEYPEWVRSANSLPMLRAGAGLLVELVPDHLRDTLGDLSEDARTAARQKQKNYERLVSPPVAPGGSSGTAREKGYTVEERDAMDRALRQLQ